MNPQARLGAFVLLALMLFGFATQRVGDFALFKQSNHLVEAEFNDLMGLDVQAPVRMAGVKVGVVQNISLKNGKAIVSIALNPDVRLPASTRASIIGRGLVGEKNLALTAKPGDTDWLPDGAIIPSDPTGDFNTFIATASGITEDIKALTDALSGTKNGKNRESLQQLITNINTAAQEMALMLKENRIQIRETTASLQRIMQQMEKELPQTTRAGRAFFEKGKQVSENFNAALVDNRENLYRTMFELRRTSENLEAFSDDIRRNPWKLMKEKPEVKPSKRAKQEKMEERMLSTGRMGLAPAHK